MPPATTASLLAAALLAGASSLAGPLAPLVYLVGFGLVVGVAVSAAARAQDRRSWGPVAAALAVWWVGDALYALLELLGLTEGLTVSEACWIAGYPLLLLGVLRMVARRAPWALVDSALDAVVLTAALGLVVWRFVLAPAAESMGMVEVVVQSLYPIGDGLVFGALVLLLLSPGRNGRSGALLVAALSFTLVGDVTAVLVDGSPLVDPLLLMANTLIAAAVAHPDRDLISAKVDAAQRSRLHPARAVFLGLALWCPTVVAAVDIVGSAAGTTAVVLAATVVCLAASARFVLSSRRREQAEAALQRRAAQDPLTGLANRRTLEEAIEHAEEGGARDHALLYLDLDGFKPVNDEHGHRSGDAVLLAVAERLVAVAGSAAVTARVGGDEFAVLVALPAERAEHLAGRLVRDLAVPVALGGATVAVGASAGVVHWRGRATASTVLHAADTVMYRAKRAGGGWCSAPLHDLKGAERPSTPDGGERSERPRAAVASGAAG